MKEQKSGDDKLVKQKRERKIQGIETVILLKTKAMEIDGNIIGA